MWSVPEAKRFPAGALLIGAFLDSTTTPVRRRALASLGGIGGLIGVSWGCGLWAQYFYHLDERPCHFERALNESAPSWCATNQSGPDWWWNASWPCDAYDYSYAAWENCSESYEEWWNGSDSYGGYFSYSYGASEDGQRTYAALDVGDFALVLAPGLLYVLWGFCDASVRQDGPRGVWTTPHLAASSAGSSARGGSPHVRAVAPGQRWSCVAKSRRFLCLLDLPGAVLGLLDTWAARRDA